MAQITIPSAARRWFLERLQLAIGRAPVRLVLGQDEVLPISTPVATVTFASLGTLASLLLDPENAFAEGYAQGRIQVEGDLAALLETVYRARTGRPRTWPARLASAWTGLMQHNSRHGSRRNIHHHYDIRTDFYQLWLDPDLVYTCAYFPRTGMTLEAAQRAKLDHVCRKLRLQPGERVAEAGCGWGALALHMARHYGARVRAFNVSHEQIVYAQRRASQEGLADRVEFIEDDYRNIGRGYDAFVSIGMLEHVGRSHYRDLGAAIHHAVGDAGRGLLHFIGRAQPRPLNTWIRRRIFPGAYPPTVREMLAVLEPRNLALLDVENLRPHYARTLEHWLERFERNAARVEEMFGAEFVRAWRLYLAGSVAAFRVGAMQLFQAVFAGPACATIPWTREHLYDTGREARFEERAQERPDDHPDKPWKHVMS